MKKKKEEGVMTCDQVTWDPIVFLFLAARQWAGSCHHVINKPLMKRRRPRRMRSPDPVEYDSDWSSENQQQRCFGKNDFTAGGKSCYFFCRKEKSVACPTVATFLGAGAVFGCCVSPSSEDSARNALGFFKLGAAASARALAAAAASWARAMAARTEAVTAGNNQSTAVAHDTCTRDWSVTVAAAGSILVRVVLKPTARALQQVCFVPCATLTTTDATHIAQRWLPFVVVVLLRRTLGHCHFLARARQRVERVRCGSSSFEEIAGKRHAGAGRVFDVALRKDNKSIEHLSTV